MNSKFRNPYIMNNEQEDTEVAQENIAESPPSSTAFNIDGSIPSPISSAKRRRALQKRVVQIPIKENEGSRLKGESNTPPSDSWAWRKYGQKPIKGSPYPRGYYRCSSSKGCPARKQVERSRMDPTMLVITYSSDHNHPWPVSRNYNNNNNNNNNVRPIVKKPEPDPIEPEEKFASLDGDELGWLETTSSAMLPIMAEYDADVLLPMGEEEESLFADLEELPECSTVFRHGLLNDRRRFTAPWCGTTS